MSGAKSEWLGELGGGERTAGGKDTLDPGGVRPKVQPHRTAWCRFKGWAAGAMLCEPPGP